MAETTSLRAVSVQYAVTEAHLLRSMITARRSTRPWLPVVIQTPARFPTNLRSQEMYEA